MDLGIDGTPQLLCERRADQRRRLPQDQLWMVIDRALRAEGEQPPAYAACGSFSPGQPSRRQVTRRGLSRAPVSGFILECLGFYGSRRRDQLASRIDFSARVPVLPWLCSCRQRLCSAVLSGCHRSPSSDVVATVNGKEILRADLERNYQISLGDNPQSPRPRRLTSCGSMFCTR